MRSVAITDIEADNLLLDVSKFHCAVIIDANTKEVFRFDQMHRPLLGYIKKLREFNTVVYHNGIGYDIPALKKLLHGVDPLLDHQEMIDTLLLSQLLIFQDNLIKSDYRRKIVPPKLYGSYGLKAFGLRFGMHKGDYTDFSRWTPEMTEYCVQDCHITLKLYEELMKCDDIPWSTYKVEEQTRETITVQYQNGINFDENLALETKSKLLSRREVLILELKDQFKPFYTYAGTKTFTPKKDNKRYHYVAGAPCQKIKKVEFDPGSRHHVALMMMRHFNWIPDRFSPKEKVKMDVQYEYDRLGIEETTMPKVDYEALQMMTAEGSNGIKEYMMLKMRMGQLFNGKSSFLNNVRDGRIHHKVNTCRARSRRMGHSRPNVGQTTGTEAEWGKEFRSMFTADHGWLFVGADVSSLESRTKAHVLYPFDGGDFIKVVEQGTIHETNMKYLDVQLKKTAKAFYFAFIFSAASLKLGSVLFSDPAYVDYKGSIKELGAERMSVFMERFPGLKETIESLQKEAEQGWIRAIDGSKLPVNETRKALNVSCQGNGSIIFKKASCIVADRFKKEGLVNGKDYKWLIHLHDEIDYTCRKDLAEFIANTTVDAFKEAGEYFKLNVEITGEAKIGKNWYECH